jgi:hypothetical protein
MIKVCYGKKEVLVCESNVVVGEDEKRRKEEMRERSGWSNQEGRTANAVKRTSNCQRQ